MLRSYRKNAAGRPDTATSGSHPNDITRLRSRVHPTAPFLCPTPDQAPQSNQLFERVLDPFDLIVFLADWLKYVHSCQEELGKAV